MEQPHLLLLALEDRPDPAIVVQSSPERQTIDPSDESTSLVYRRMRRQLLARGLTRRHSDTKPKDGYQRARTTRLQRQLAIIDEFHRQKARDEEALKKAREDTELRRALSASNVVAPQTLGPFSRKSNLRHLSSNAQVFPSRNQLEEHRLPPTASDIEQYAVLASQMAKPAHAGPIKGLLDANDRPEKAIKPKESRSTASLDKSTAQVLCELKISKDIMMREHLVEQIHEIASTLSKIAGELHEMSQLKAKLDGSPNNAAGALAKRRSSSAIMSASTNAKQQPKGNEIDESPVDPSGRERDVQEWETRTAECTQRAQHRVLQLHRLIASLQSTTIDIVESILEWRELKSRRTAFTNVEKLQRFAWKKRHIANYLIHIDTDLRGLFPSPGMSVLLGVNSKYNPLLLPQSTMEALGIPDESFVSTTFLTERREVKTIKIEYPSPTRRQAHAALQTAVRTPAKSPPQLSLDAERTRRCLESIQLELQLEQAALTRETGEKVRLAAAYNPFETIKVAGGVEGTIRSVIKRQAAGQAAELAEQLRRRQEDTARMKDPDVVSSSDTSRRELPGATPSLHVNPRRLRLLIEQRKESREAAIDCELQDTAATWKKNKLHGQVMVRKMNIRRFENQHARKIQRQFQAYRKRTQLLTNLARFVIISRQRVVSIQKIVRGFIAKRRYQLAKQHQELQRTRHAAAKLIWFTYKRYKRRLRHRQSMSVEAIAHIQLLQVIQQQLDAADDQDPTTSAERYRRVGEERRRQRAVVLHKRRQELLELEAKKVAAATRIQSLYRMHSAKQLAVALRGERRAHFSAVSAMMIQSKIRKFLKYQERRRQRFRSDMERVNRSAVRIQSIYRGYNSRAGLLTELEESIRHGELQPFQDAEDGDEEDTEELTMRDGDGSASEGYAVLPPIVTSRPTTSSANDRQPVKMPAYEDEDAGDDEDDADDHVGSPIENVHRMVARTSLSSPRKLSLPPIRPRAQSVEPMTLVAPRKAQPPPVCRQTPSSMMKVELKLKETTLGDDFDGGSTPPTAGFLGPFRRRSSGTSSATSSSFRATMPPQ